MPRLSLAGFLSTGLVLSLFTAAPAQEQRKGILPGGDGEAKFLKDYSASKAVFGTINRANEGEKASKDSAEHKAAIDMAAQYYTYRLTWDKSGEPGETDKLMTEFFSQVTSANSAEMRKGNPVFSELYLKALAARARDVVQTNQLIAAVNAARMLARLAELGIVEAGDACLEVVRNDKDFVDPVARMGAQYWALKGLGSLLARWAEAPAGADGTPAVPADRKEREANYVAALTATIESFVPAGGKTSVALAEGSPEEVGLQLFRREAVRALAQYRNPAVADDKGAIKVKSALALLRVTNDDGLVPHARLDEQMDAAWGLARLRDKGLAAYQPDYAAQQIGYVIVQMALNARPAKQDTSKVPWKYHAARLADALEVMRDEAKGSSNKAAAAYVDKVVGQSLRVLKDIEQKEQAGGGGDLKLWLGANAPPDETLYRGVADSTVHPLDRPDTPEKPDKPEKPKEEKKPGDKKPGKP
jgi:hypothetical protein